MKQCPKCKGYDIKELKAIGGMKRLICMKCGFQINLDKNKVKKKD